ncbi:hypothetical protein J5N97_017094 [Dioscorea zingiberensis]|uniref:Uncharacterized protein n=1 Tax=Dioscorea zingiberensis TaxID=325984 RepID=A0A9D5CLN5_9LILI|nr:hypothetical protein J5N97_017094 [Dioscorea zingiberensis]
MQQWIAQGRSRGRLRRRKTRTSSVVVLLRSPMCTKSPAGLSILAMEFLSQRNIGRLRTITHHKAPSAFAGRYMFVVHGVKAAQATKRVRLCGVQEMRISQDSKTLEVVE